MAAVENTPVPVEVKPGVRTTEFWLTLLPYLLMILKEGTGIDLAPDMIANGILGAVAAISTIAYILGRVRVKNRVAELNMLDRESSDN